MAGTITFFDILVYTRRDLGKKQYLCINMRPKIYIDTSVIGGYYDAEFAKATQQLFGRIANGEYEVYYSEVNENELQLAPQHVKQVKTLIPADCFHYIRQTPASKTLAAMYITENALGSASEKDAFHIALVSVNAVDFLISWNFKHMVNEDKIKMFNAINRRCGYPAVVIYSPLKFLEL
jgi:predicted nucleic acid-binding protein